jgi:hypothetical protein
MAGVLGIRRFFEPVTALLLWQYESHIQALENRLKILNLELESSKKRIHELEYKNTELECSYGSRHKNVLKESTVKPIINAARQRFLDGIKRSPSM